MSVADWVLLVVLWGISIWRLPAALRSYQHRMLWGAFTALAISRVFSANPVVEWTIDLTGREWATLLRHLGGLLSAASLLAFVEAITRGAGRSRARWIWPAAAVVVGVLVALFAIRGGRIYWVAGQPGETATAGRIYLLVFDSWLIYCLGMAGVMFARFSRTAPTLLKVGMVISAVSMAAGVLNRGHVMVVNLANLLFPQWGLREWGLFHGVTIVVTVVGIALGTSIAGVPAVVGHVRQRAALRELRPLWAALTRQYPDIALGMAGPVRVRLYRRGIEIRDGMLALTSVAEPPADGTPERVAAWVAEALEGAAAGAGSGQPSGVVPGPDFHGDMGRELAWLRQVAAAYKQHSGMSRARGSRVS
ncbi:MAB_1171c family putative transporter (plasmid) [Streptosporangium sandarakinum]|uniref:MAB_1171c family putative transporter n=1 Tax=Streptosporangium sandarakinum TaxID=1260955 RepID=UPI003D8F7540